MAVSANIDDLLKYSLAARDQEWEHAFFHAFLQAKVRIVSDSPVQGPDGWPYLLVETTDEGSEPAYKVLGWLSDKGIGLVVNPNKDAPDYVFTYGMIWNYRERGEFLSFADQSKERVTVQKIELVDGQKIVAGVPSDNYLPPYARTILKAFFRDNGISEMKVLMMSKNETKMQGNESGTPTHYDLCFSLEALGAPVQQEHKGILEALAWFLPAHYSLLLISEKGLPPFANL